MPSVYDDPVGNNTRKVQPSSRFGTRQIKFLMLSLNSYDLYNDVTDFDNFIDRPSAYKNPDSLYSKIVRTIQEVGEFYELGGPSALDRYSFVFGIASETGQWFYSDRGNNDYNENGIDETDATNPNRYFRSGGSGVNDLVDRLFNLFYRSDELGYDTYDVYGIYDFNLRELEDTGAGLMPANYLT